MPEQAVHLRAALAAADQRTDASDDDGTVDAAFDQAAKPALICNTRNMHGQTTMLTPHRFDVTTMPIS